MIRVEDGRRTGFLIDWELSRLESELGEGPVKPDRAVCSFKLPSSGLWLILTQGTWQFRSALSLQYPRKPYRRSDDIESFIHAYLYLVLRYHETRVSSVKDVVMSLFEQVSLVGGTKVGGDAKLAMIEAGKAPFRIESNTPLQDLILKLIRGCSLAYSQLDFDAMDRFYGPDRKARPHASDSSSSDSDSPLLPGACARERYMESDDEMSAASDDDAVERAVESDREDSETYPSSSMDLCKLGTFLTNPRIMAKLFVEHS